MEDPTQKLMAAYAVRCAEVECERVGVNDPAVLQAISAQLKVTTNEQGEVIAHGPKGETVRELLDGLNVARNAPAPTGALDVSEVFSWRSDQKMAYIRENGREEFCELLRRAAAAQKQAIDKRLRGF